jgi:hypothetical protein
MSSSILSPLDRFEDALSRARVPEPRLPIGLGYLLAGVSSLFLWGLFGAALWGFFG